jgi:hypothetical protein
MMARSKLKASSPIEPRFMKHLTFGHDVDEDGRECLVVMRYCRTNGESVWVLERVLRSGPEQN